MNNAALGYDGVLATMHESQIEELVRVNILAAIFLAKYACRSMLLQREGRIVNVASIIAHDRVQWSVRVCGHQVGADRIHEITGP